MEGRNLEWFIRRGAVFGILVSDFLILIVLLNYLFRIGNDEFLYIL